MKTIGDYLERLRLEISWLSKTRNNTLVEDYKDHLEAAYAEFKGKRTGVVSEALLEEDFIKEQEDPLTIANSIVEEPRGAVNYRIRRKIGHFVLRGKKIMANYSQSYSQSKYYTPFGDGVIFFGWLLSIMILNAVTVSILISIFLLIYGFNPKIGLLLYNILGPVVETVHFTVLYLYLFAGILVFVEKKGLKRVTVAVFHGVSLIFPLVFFLGSSGVDHFISRTWSRTTFLSIHYYWGPEFVLDIKRYRTLEETVLDWLGYDFKIIIDALIVLLVFALMAKVLLVARDWIVKAPCGKTRSRSLQVLVVSIILVIILTVSFVTQGLITVPDTNIPTPAEAQLVYWFGFKGENGSRSFGQITVPFLNTSLPYSDSLLVFQFSEPAPSSLMEQSVYTVDRYSSTYTTRLFGVFYLPAMLGGKNWTEVVANDISALDIFQGFTVRADLEDSKIQWNTATDNWGKERVITIPVRTVVAISDSDPSIHYRFHFDSRTGWLMDAYLQQPFETSFPVTYGSLEIRRLFTLPMQPEDLVPYIMAYNTGITAIFIFFGAVNLILLVPQVRTVLMYQKKRSDRTIDQAED